MALHSTIAIQRIQPPIDLTQSIQMALHYTIAATGFNTGTPPLVKKTSRA
jgi:hypothetical protein